MDREVVRTWGPVALLLVLLPLGFVGLRGCLPPIGPRHPPPPPVPAVGAASCGECHAEEQRGWARSTHARAESEVPADLPWTVQLGDAPAPAPVRALGVDPLVQFLVPFDGGRLQVTQAAWDPEKREWFDVFADGRAPGEWGHWTGGAMTWNSQCAACHSTGVDKGYDEASATYRTTVLQAGVGCGACHGDVRAHAAGGPAPAVSDTLDACAPCHARRAELTARWEVGDAFLDDFAPQLVDRTDVFWPDGQVRGEDFEYTAFLGSKMHERGVTCTSCHDPHSGELRAQGDALCLSCHAAQPTFTAHDPHQATVGCVGCHMPVTTYMQRDPRHDHGFTVPDPELNVRYGIPDACTRCHTDRDPKWAAKVAATWWPSVQGNGLRSAESLGGLRRARAVALARGRAGDAGAVPELLRLVAGETPPWRAAAAAMLEGFTDRPDVRRALQVALGDPDGHVRFAAVGALEQAAGDPEVGPALTGLLGDPLRAVRVQAERALRGQLTPADPRAADYVGYLAHNADTPAALLERGTWALDQGRLAPAVADLTRAVAVDAGSAGARQALALALARYGQAGPAAEQLRTAAKLAPQDAGVYFQLGLAEAGVQDLPAAEAALTRAVALDPDDARGWYNLGLVRAQRGEDGLEALRRSEALTPQDPEPAYAVASALFNAGRVDQARRQAAKVLQLAPDHAGAQAILASTP